MEQNEFYCRSFVPSSPPPSPAPVTPGPGWERPGSLPWSDDLLEGAVRRSRGGFCLRESSGGFRLAYPLSCRTPFPLPPLFCFARVECLCGRPWWTFSFRPDGTPCFEGA